VETGQRAERVIAVRLRHPKIAVGLERGARREVREGERTLLGPVVRNLPDGVTDEGPRRDVLQGAGAEHSIDDLLLGHREVVEAGQVATRLRLHGILLQLRVEEGGVDLVVAFVVEVEAEGGEAGRLLFHLADRQVVLALAQAELSEREIPGPFERAGDLDEAGRAGTAELEARGRA
jgi:hypothetical protein